MSDDLVERLRIRQPLLGKLCDEAADEITRLHAENDHLNTENEKAWNEIERLKAALQYARNLTGPDEIIDAVLAPPNKQPAGDLYCEHRIRIGEEP